MDGHIKSKAWGLGPAPTALAMSVALNGTGNPTTLRYPTGCKPTVTRSATGTLAFVLPQGCGVPNQVQAIVVTPQFDAAADWFECGVIAETTLTSSTRGFTVFTHKGGTATDVAAAAGSRVNVAIFFDDSTGA